MTNAQLSAIKRNISSFDIEAFKRNQLKLYLLADAIESTSLDLIQQMKSVGVYRFEDKRAIDAVKHNAGSLVRDLDTICTEDYACHFGDISDEFIELLNKFLKGKKELEHEKK